MKYSGLPWAMWRVFSPSFKKQLDLIYDGPADPVLSRAYKKYRQIVESLPEFDKEDRFLMNILSAAMLAAVYLSLDIKPSGRQVENYYHRAMTENPVMRLFLKKSDNYSSRKQKKLEKGAEISRDLYAKNPYTWIYTFQKDGKDAFTTVFTTCGIKKLFDDLGISEITPAMCTYDYDMAELSGSHFSRNCTLVNGNCCDCHYRKK